MVMLPFADISAAATNTTTAPIAAMTTTAKGKFMTIQSRTLGRDANGLALHALERH